METYVARQPIFNKSMAIFGYELLYRQKPDSLEYDGQNSDSASTETISNSFYNIGIERVTGGKRAFINFTDKLILEGIPTLLPDRIVVVEVLEAVEPSDELIQALNRLRGKGYTIAMNDFILSPVYVPFLQVTDIVKIDFQSTPFKRIEQIVQLMKGKQIRMLADKVETLEEFDRAKEMGFSLFQGFFFSQPDIVPARGELTINPLEINCMQLIKCVFEPTVNYTMISDIIKRDVALSYRLLRVVNSAFFGLKYTVKNIRQALAILGMDEVKKWVTLISLSEFSETKPEELVRMSLIRAKMLESIAPFAGMARDTEDLFMLGMLSLMDAICDLSFEDIVERTSISPVIASPLLTGSGKFAPLLKLVKLYERNDWDGAMALAEALQISFSKVSDAYIDAANWANTL